MRGTRKDLVAPERNPEERSAEDSREISSKKLTSVLRCEWSESVVSGAPVADLRGLFKSEEWRHKLKVDKGADESIQGHREGAVSLKAITPGALGPPWASASPTKCTRS